MFFDVQLGVELGGTSTPLYVGRPARKELVAHNAANNVRNLVVETDHGDLKVDLAPHEMLRMQLQVEQLAAYEDGGQGNLWVVALD